MENLASRQSLATRSNLTALEHPLRQLFHKAWNLPPPRYPPQANLWEAAKNTWNRFWTRPREPVFTERILTPGASARIPNERRDFSFQRLHDEL